MESRLPVLVKIATENWEFEQIHRLNHQTFVEEIPQHPANPSGHLVDQFHDENTYVIGLAGRQVVGMLAIRHRRPFSLERKVPDLESYLPAGRSICELRLLAVHRGYRARQLLPALLACVWRFCLRSGFDLALISAVIRQLKLYRHLGFEPFGPLVGTPPVLFQPMMLTLEQFAPRAPKLFRRSKPAGPVAANFLPGPVAVHPEVCQALQRPALSHRSTAFSAEMESTKARLRELVGAARVEILIGSGTTANDTIAGQLSLDRTPGLILSNGEFGERLVDHARRWGLTCDVIATRWGEPFDIREIERCLAQPASRSWVWFVHCETSTGVLNDLD
ncbi:MAG: N-acyl amino acid synthase FeeM domain-containing protein, partial [Vicinamibacterales bacterium]